MLNSQASCQDQTLDWRPCSYAQRRWLPLDLKPPQEQRTPFLWRLQGYLNVPALVKAFLWIQHRHAILRAHFSEDALYWRAGEDFQALEVEVGVPDAAGAAAAWLAERYSSPVTKAEPMLAARLFGRETNVHFFAGYFHHAAIDLVSGSEIWDQLWQAYEAYMLGLQPQIATSSSTFEDFCDWEAANVAEGQDLEKSWTDRLAGAEPLPRAGQTGPCIKIPVELEWSLVVALQAYAKAHSLSVPFILTALFGYACSSVLQRPRLAIGHYMSGRLPRFSHAVGCYSQLRAFVPTSVAMPLEARLKCDFAAYFATLDMRRPVPPAVADRYHLGDISVNIVPVGGPSAPRSFIGLAMDKVPAALRTAFTRSASLLLPLGPDGGSGALWVAADRISEDIGNRLLKEWLDLLNIVGIYDNDVLVEEAQS